jgi:hypothetical protein
LPLEKPTLNADANYLKVKADYPISDQHKTNDYDDLIVHSSLSWMYSACVATVVVRF